jgi:peptidyl-tRNA hydrolase
MADQDFIMYIFVNSDLEMSKGRACAQVAHCCHAIIDPIIRSAYESPQVPELYLRYSKWNLCPTTIILKATEAELTELMKLPESTKFMDNGLLTVVGFAPSDKMKEIAGKFKLF